MYYIIQDKLFQIRHYEMLIDALNKYDLPYQLVEIIPFTKDIVFEPFDTKNVFAFGSVKMAHIANKYNWTPGSFMNENMNFNVYKEFYKDNLLNYDSQIIKYSDQFKEPSSLFFARPCEDTKIFTGGVFTKASWDEMVAHGLKSGISTGFDTNIAESNVQISSLKEIQREIRCWIVKGKVITASQYRIGTKTIYQECTEPYILDYCADMVKLWAPSDAFVMDIAITDNGLKIVELNCINCAGFYDSNILKLIESLETNFNTN